MQKTTMNLLLIIYRYELRKETETFRLSYVGLLIPFIDTNSERRRKQFLHGL